MSASECVVEGMGELLKSQLVAKRAELRAIKDEGKVAMWETKTKERNPQYVIGSVRKATEEDKVALGHCHGEVCQIVCVTCGTTRLVNKQDAFQVRYCLEHKGDAKKAQAKVKTVNVEKIQARITELQAKIEAQRAVA